MPAVRLFNRRTLIGGDDLQLPSLLTILVRTFQSTFLLLPLLLHLTRDSYRHGGLLPYLLYDPSPDPSCYGAHFFPLLLSAYAAATAIYVAVSVRIELAIYRKSGVGAPTQPELRHPDVANLLEAKLVPVAIVNGLVLLLGLVAVVGYGGMYYRCLKMSEDAAADDDEANLADDDHDDHDGDAPIPTLLGPSLWWYSLTLLLLTQFAELIVSILALLRLLRRKDGLTNADLSIIGGPAEEAAALNLMLPHHHAHHHRTYGAGTHELVEQMWHDRCQSFCRCLSVSTCFLFGGRDIETGDYASIARALADYFEDGGVLDLVPSDVAAGFAMLARVQRQRALEARREVIESKRTVEEVAAMATSASGGSSSHGGGGGGGQLSVSAVRDWAVKRSVHDSIFAGVADNGSVAEVRLSSVPSASPSSSPNNNNNNVGGDNILGRNNSSCTSFGSSDGNHVRHPSALAFKMEHTDTRTWYETTRRSVLCRNDESDRAVIAEGARFARHALAIYTWVLYVYMHPLGGPCALGCGWCPPCMSGMARRARRRDGRVATGRRSREARRGSSHDPLRSPVGAGGGGDDMDMDAGDGGAYDDDDDDDGCGGGNGRDVCCPSGDDGLIIGDNCCRVHRTALLAHAGLVGADLAYAQLKSSFRETPYCIVIDHRWRSVVLAVRGTLSLEDCVVDVLVDPEPLEGIGLEYGFDGSGQHCHSGALVCTQWIYRDLQSRGILERLLLGPNAEYPSYDLRIVGHSIGAACATLLSYMMRRRYPNLRCLCYSPPGGFITWKLATECKDFCTSFVLDSDLVPRLSVDTMEHLRNEILELIGRLKVPKIEVVEHVVMGVLPCVGNTDEEEDLGLLVENNARMLHASIPPETDFAHQLEQVRAIQSERRRSRGAVRDVPLYPPGRICHLVKTGESKSCRHGLIRCGTCFTTNVGSEYTPVWVENDDLNEIVVSPTMGTDHFPNRVCLEIEGVAAAFGLDTSLGSSRSDRERASLSSPARDPSQLLCNDERGARRIVDNLYC